MILFGLALTLFAYFVATLLYRRVPRPWMNPILTTALAIMAVLVVSRVSYADYVRGAQVYTWLLQPATVAFAVPLYRYRQLLRRYGLAMLAGVAAGSMSAVVSSVYFARWLHLAPAVVTSLVPRSVTTPIAMDISRVIGGVPVMTAVFVIVTGVLGSVMGPFVLRVLRLRSRVARGALFGVAAHGVGTARALELGPREGTVSSLTMILTGLLTVVLAPFLVRML
ncbi:CidB/LrgB family autolysis modulator [Kyrpidia spormannii]|uniref:CidB/LrgB family autolysis modulator n=1 Tax=Kyrpidia spormannii TaxID=2055160 RepID=A0A2K8NAW0_9BACL|nr:LrgB family protein [Kyrpidia spormannii]ATY86461.1 CidB/LrgB family autolysis modulator [Kyrpidia spormannii]